GLISFNGGSTVSANAGGTGSSVGGSISMIGGNIDLTGGSQVFSANSVGTGFGGVVSIFSYQDINTTGSSSVQVTAMGSFPGHVILQADRNLILSSGPGINVSALAGNQNGGTITVGAGLAGPGTLQINQGLIANGMGSGNGGSVNVTYND